MKYKYINDPYQPEVVTIHTRVRTTKKKRFCDYCKCEIAVGEKYAKTVMLIDGEFEQHISHPEWKDCYERIV